MPADADAAALEAAARADEKIAGYLDGATVRRVVAVPGRLVNFVLGLTPVRPTGWMRMISLRSVARRDSRCTTRPVT